MKACGTVGSEVYDLWSNDQTLTASSVFWTDAALSEWSTSVAPLGWYSDGNTAWLISNTGGGSVTANVSCGGTTTDSGSGSGSGGGVGIVNSITLDSYSVSIGNAGGVQVIGMDVVPADSPNKTYLVAYLPPPNPESPAAGTITFWDDDTGTGTQVAMPTWISNVAGQWQAETSSGSGSGYVQFEADAGAEDPIIR